MLDVSRKELKYLLTVREAYDIKERLGTVMETDIHGRRGEYHVRSLYFDTLMDADYEDKVNGYEKRQKIRLRVYHPWDETVKLELKEKKGGTQRKRSIVISRQDAQSMLRGDYTCLMKRQEELAHQLYVFMVTRCYQPKCIVAYDRMAYFRRENDMRVTFDYKLGASEANLDIFDANLMLYPAAPANEVTMEVKYNGFLHSYVKNIISQSNRMQISNSKYCRARMISKRGRR